jgi:hypothetical protein
VRDRTTPILTTVRTVPQPSLGASFLPPENPGKASAHFGYPFARVYERDPHPEGLESLSPMREFRSLSLTQSIPPPLQFWGGPLRQDGPLRMQHVQLGPLPAGGLQVSLSYAGLIAQSSAIGLGCPAKPATAAASVS